MLFHMRRNDCSLQSRKLAQPFHRQGDIDFGPVPLESDHGDVLPAVTLCLCKCRPDRQPLDVLALTVDAIDHDDIRRVR